MQVESRTKQTCLFLYRGAAYLRYFYSKDTTKGRFRKKETPFLYSRIQLYLLDNFHAFFNGGFVHRNQIVMTGG